MPSMFDNNLMQRVIVALIGIPLLLWLIFLGGTPFLALVLLLALVAVVEFHRLAARRAAPSSLLLQVPLTLLLLVNVQFRFVDNWSALLAAVMLLYLVELWRLQGSRFTSLGSTLVGFIYVNFSFGALLLLRKDGTGAGADSGAGLLFLTFICIWGADIFAYFGGRTFGGRFVRRKLFARLSPQKTWEGYFSGIAGSMLAASVCVWSVASCPSALAWKIGLLVGVAGPVGDLMESMFKRDAGVKDSSGIIPGHGGVLDRFDTLMFLSPLLYLLLHGA